jgi:hypothetical protein
MMTIYRCTAQGHTPQGELWVTGLHVELVGGTIADAGSAWHDAFNLLWLGAATPADSIKQFLSTASGCDETVVNSLNPITLKNVEQKRTSETLVGTSSAEQWPAQDAVLVSLRTGVPTRAGRGRMFLPPFTVDAETTSGLLDSTSQTRVLAAAAGMLGSLIGSTYQPVILHRDSRTTTNIVSVDVPDLPGTQRRRINKVARVRMSTTL